MKKGKALRTVKEICAAARDCAHCPFLNVAALCRFERVCPRYWQIVSLHHTLEGVVYYPYEVARKILRIKTMCCDNAPEHIRLNPWRDCRGCKFYSKKKGRCRLYGIPRLWRVGKPYRRAIIRHPH